MMDHYGYKGLVEGEEQQGPGECADEPWYPYDPEEFMETEMEEITATSQFEDQMKICYGMIQKVRVKVLPQASQLLNRVPIVQIVTQTLEKQDVYIFMVFSEGDNQKFLLQPPRSVDEEAQIFDNVAVVNRDSSTVFSQIATFCTFEASCSIDLWASIPSGTTTIDKDTFILVDINIYGDLKHCDEVGDILSTRKVYLQEPDYRDSRCGYKNPHFLDLNSNYPSTDMDVDPLGSSLLQRDLDFQQPGDSNKKVLAQSLLKEKLAVVFKSMTRSQNLKRITADTNRVHTNLKPYQEEALDFILQREYGAISEEFCLWKHKSQNLYIHSITGFEKNEIPRETGGGILADEMGLGKTLTMLSAIIRTTNEAKLFACGIPDGALLTIKNMLIPSRATLVVVPSPLLLNEWLQELKLHCTGFSKPIIYHSHGREGDPKVLADSDIVLSTYHTIAAESRDTTSPLWKIKWFRIVLDEAHIIRRMTTKLFKSIKSLQSNFRWCLTGTPIQNSLEDLAALVNFIQSYPLDDFHVFKKHIISPLMKGSEKGVDNLRQLLDSICLRRTKQLLNLPEVISESRLLSFSSREKKQYIDTRDELVKIINQNRLQPQNKSYLGVFQLQLQLRRLCNHGTFQKKYIGVQDFDPEQAIAHLRKQKQAMCEVCGIHVTGIHGIEEQRSGSFTTCGHLLCSKCIPEMMRALQKINGQDGCLQCSLCPETIFGEYLVTEEASSKPPRSGSENLSAWQFFDKGGCSTKISAAVTDIEQHKTEGKSIVFSCWTRSLDLIGIFLKSRNIAFVRIDGSHTLPQRKWILEVFQKDSEIKILLMTTGTGAVGLNLTVANCVYILEPQWNPMVEIQAIARVNRMGQTRNVRVVRYIMKDTVEELELQSQQIRKLEYAKVGWKEDDC
ncbi:hypothetical protein N431DRAFT_375776 [Stipitochalara longipes BDJ]|nr:hypothetical protein N431DRAFT_375776 [Stipitochalara longipes BDJ]